MGRLCGSVVLASLLCQSVITAQKAAKSECTAKATWHDGREEER